jgi:hypothetical protein
MPRYFEIRRYIFDTTLDTFAVAGGLAAGRVRTITSKLG